MAPQAGFEPATLRLTAECRWLDSQVLRASSLGENLLVPGVRQIIVQRLCRAWFEPRSVDPQYCGVQCGPVSNLLVEVEHVSDRSCNLRD
jgi:hypothetical protein